MIHFRLAGQREKLALEGSYPQALRRRPLYHQWRTYDALHDVPVVINTYNTGTGKTQAALLHLLDQPTSDVLFIAPTNELIAQHVRSIRAFVNSHELDFAVMPARAADVASLHNPDKLRKGELLHRLITNYTEFSDATRRKPLVMVTNPDIFYYALFFRYGMHDQRNLFSDFIRRFNYIVIDEFHYYNNKQMANFLFALALFQEWGYFDGYGRRVCLLSATPRDNVRQYLHELFDNDLRWIAPANEPPASAEYDTVPTLTPLDVLVAPGRLADWVSSSASQLNTWLQHEQDGVLISNSLAQINLSYGRLHATLEQALMGRITGPEPPEARSSGSQRPLILATPTVDIGYNFDKDNKPRQNIDFVVCEARFQDELLQRIGRAGRILGKTQTQHESQAVILLPDDAYSAFSALDGQTLSRTEFADWLRDNSPLQHKHQLARYIKSYAIQEVFHPLHALRSMMPPDSLQELAALFERLQRLYHAPQKLNYNSLRQQAKRTRERGDWLKAISEGPDSPPTGTDKHLSDWYEHQHNTRREFTHDEGLSVWRHPEMRAGLIAFVRSQHALAQALFNFRDAFNGPVAAFYDPQRMFSTQTVNTYDLFHLLSHYRLSEPLSRAEFKRLCADAQPPEADYYLHLRKPREEPLRVAFMLNTSGDLSDFERDWTRRPVAIQNLHIELHRADGSPVRGALGTLSAALAEQAVVALIVPPEHSWIHRRIMPHGYYSYDLTVNAADQQKSGYRLYAGTAAFEVYAELEGHFKRLQWQECAVIIT